MRIVKVIGVRCRYGSKNSSNDERRRRSDAEHYCIRIEHRSGELGSTSMQPSVFAVRCSLVCCLIAYKFAMLV